VVLSDPRKMIGWRSCNSSGLAHSLSNLVVYRLLQPPPTESKETGQARSATPGVHCARQFAWAIVTRPRSCQIIRRHALSVRDCSSMKGWRRVCVKPPSSKWQLPRLPTHSFQESLATTLFWTSSVASSRKPSSSVCAQWAARWMAWSGMGATEVCGPSGRAGTPGAGTPGAGVTGAGVTGAGVTGAGVTGAGLCSRMTLAQPFSTRRNRTLASLLPPRVGVMI